MRISDWSSDVCSSDLFDCRWQDLCLRLIVGERHIGIFGCGDLGGATCPLLFSLDSRAAPIAFDIHLEDGGVVHEAVDGGQRHCGIGEDPVPFAERLVGGYHQRTPLVSRARSEEHTSELQSLMRISYAVFCLK